MTVDPDAFGPPNHADALTDMVMKQKWLQSRMPPLRKPPGELMGNERADYIRTMVLAATSELHEAMDETGWKPWATSRHLNRDAYVSELIDVLLFWLNLCLVANVSTDEIHTGYIKAFNKALQRQANGYDGVEGKCPHCHRSYDDVFVECETGVYSKVNPKDNSGERYWWCSEVEEYVTDKGQSTTPSKTVTNMLKEWGESWNTSSPSTNPGTSA